MLQPAFVRDKTSLLSVFRTDAILCCSQCLKCNMPRVVLGFTVLALWLYLTTSISSPLSQSTMLHEYRSSVQNTPDPKIYSNGNNTYNNTSRKVQQHHQQPRAISDLDNIHEFVNSARIFVSVSSFRDPLCGRTLASLFRQADNAARVFVGVCQQNIDVEDRDCLYEWQRVTPQLHRRHFVEQTQVRVFDMSAKEAKGPTYARALIAHLLYAQEEFFLQLDSHTALEPHWDTKIIQMWLNTASTMDERRWSVLSNYPRALVFDPDPDLTEIWTNSTLERQFNVFYGLHPYSSSVTTSQSQSNTEFCPEICTAVYQPGDHSSAPKPSDDTSLPFAGMLELRGQEVPIAASDSQRSTTSQKRPLKPHYAHKKQSTDVEAVATANNTNGTPPSLTAFASAGWLFGAREMLHDCPYDLNLPFLFMGEEILYSARLWTHGYNIYSLSENLARHFYYRRKLPKFWSDPHYVNDEAARSKRKVQQWLKLGREFWSSASDHFQTNRSTEISLFGLGATRTLLDYYEFIGLDPRHEVVRYNFCPEYN
jgi:hypothetical protein